MTIIEDGVLFDAYEIIGSGITIISVLTIRNQRRYG